MKYLIYLTAAIAILLLNACSENSVAIDMANKWCSCNEKMGELSKAFHREQDPAAQSEIAVQILREQQQVLSCMGGEENLISLNKNYKGSNFQKKYDQTRKEECPKLLELLNKK